VNGRSQGCPSSHEVGPPLPAPLRAELVEALARLLRVDLKRRPVQADISEASGPVTQEHVETPR
jgi:hypothetical protein